VNFFFPSNLPIQAGVQYYFQLVVQSGNLWTAFGDAFNYSGGDLYVDGNPATLADLWFAKELLSQSHHCPHFSFAQPDCGSRPADQGWVTDIFAIQEKGSSQGQTKHDSFCRLTRFG
jgi:hypothetical protein